MVKNALNSIAANYFLVLVMGEVLPRCGPWNILSNRFKCPHLKKYLAIPRPFHINKIGSILLPLQELLRALLAV
jgi:hypothetical protein